MCIVRRDVKTTKVTIHSGFKAKHYGSISDADKIVNNVLDQKGVFLYYNYTLKVPFGSVDRQKSY